MAYTRVARTLTSREQLAERWTLRRLGSLTHERRVAAIASDLFDLTRAMHGLDLSHRRLLRLGAIVHDVGRATDDRRHPTIGAAMVMEDRSLPVSLQDRRRLAYVTRYHRGAVPEAGFDGILLPGDERKAMRKVLGLLRAADTLDNRTIAAPRILLAMKGRKLRITCFIEQDCAKARRAFSRRKKFRLLEEVLGCRVEVRIKLADALEVV